MSDNLYIEQAPMPQLEIRNPYNRFWRLMVITMMDKPKNLKEWLWFLYGYDIFYGPIPFLKSLVAANVLVWLLLLWLHP